AARAGCALGPCGRICRDIFSPALSQSFNPITPSADVAGKVLPAHPAFTRPGTGFRSQRWLPWDHIAILAQATHIPMQSMLSWTAAARVQPEGSLSVVAG